MSAQPSDLTDHLGYRLRQLSNHVSHAFARKLADRQVTVAEWVVMRTLHGQDPIAPSQLAARMGLTRGAVTRLADRLVEKALLDRLANPDDGRAQTLSLTERGATLVPQLAALADHNEAECFAHLSADDRAVLLRILTETIDRLGLRAPPVD